MIQPGTVVHRIGETRQYRLLTYRLRQRLMSHECDLLAVMTPLAESMVKEVFENPDKLVEQEK